MPFITVYIQKYVCVCVCVCVCVMGRLELVVLLKKEDLFTDGEQRSQLSQQEQEINWVEYEEVGGLLCSRSFTSAIIIIIIVITISIIVFIILVIISIVILFSFKLSSLFLLLVVSF